MGYRKNRLTLIKTCKNIFTLILSVFFLYNFANETDPSIIDSLTREAYLNARINADLSISTAHRSLSDSKRTNYKKGIADASLALGAAYLAKYNPNDSSGYYYHHSLDIYRQLNDPLGVGRSCYGLSYVYNFKSQPDKALEFAYRSMENFEKAGSSRELIAALEATIFLEKQQDNYEKALELSNKAIEIAGSINDTVQWAAALNNKGNVLKDMFLFNPAIDAYFEAFNLWKLSNDTSGLAIAFGSIANAYFFEGDYDKSLEYNFKKLYIIKNTKNSWETNKTLNNIALSYSQINKHDSALYYMNQSLGIAKRINYPEGIATSYDNMASTYLSLGNTDSTLFYITKAMAIAQKINSPNLAKFELNKAMALSKKKNYTDALALAKKAYKGAKQKKDNHTLKDASWLLNDIYYHLGQRDLAYPYLTEYMKLSDSISNMEFMRKVTRLDIKYEYETEQRKAQYEIDMLAKNNQLKTERLRKTWIVLIALMLLSLAGAGISLLLIRNKNHRIEQMNLEIRNYLFQLDKLKAGSKNDNHIAELSKSYGLTQRETEIMELISTGIGNEEIADKLFVSKNTIKFHIKNIFIKLDVRNRVQALQKIAG
jgi:DNA-binding CsgD family transcriptional regulator